MKELAKKIGLTTEKLYQYVKAPPSDNVDLETSYPEGDTFIPIDPLGSLLLLVGTRISDLELLLEGKKNNLAIHRRLVNSYFEEATFGVVDAIVLLGIIITKRLTTNDIPSFTVGQDPESTQFFEYLQVHSSY